VSATVIAAQNVHGDAAGGKSPVVTGPRVSVSVSGARCLKQTQQKNGTLTDVLPLRTSTKVTAVYRRVQCTREGDQGPPVHESDGIMTCLVPNPH
jgi:hypothetical protein